MSEPRRIAIFQANWVLQVHTINLAESFAANGIDVDVYLYNVERTFADFTIGAGPGKVRVLDLTGDYSKPVTRTYRGMYRIAQLKENADRWLGYRDLNYILPDGLVARTFSPARECHYSCLIGIEAFGLVWAGRVSDALHVPLVYYSLELYTRDYPTRQTPYYRRLKGWESRYHIKCAATIVQDPERAKVLFQDTGARANKLFLIPVSLRGPCSTMKTKHLHRLLGISEQKRIALYFGQIVAGRYAAEMVTAAQALSEDWVLVLHGFMADQDGSLRRQLDALNARGRALFSLTIVSPDDVAALVASADVGLVLYSSATANEYLTGYASEKAALYARSGVPMIAFAKSNFPEVFARYHCGAAVSKVSELDTAVETIVSDYANFVQGAQSAYENVYEFSRHFPPLLNWVETL